jgi:hypothetical protein
VITELDPRLPFGFNSIHSGTFQVSRTMLDMSVQFFLQLALRSTTEKELSA